MTILTVYDILVVRLGYDRAAFRRAKTASGTSPNDDWLALIAVSLTPANTSMPTSARTPSKILVI